MAFGLVDRVLPPIEPMALQRAGRVGEIVAVRAPADDGRDLTPPAAQPRLKRFRGTVSRGVQIGMYEGAGGCQATWVLVVALSW
jgi:hypothetical protein